MRFVIKIAITAVGVWVADLVVPGIMFDGSVWNLVGVALLVALANAIVKPILNVLSIPFIVLTLGFFLLVTNSLMLQLVVWLSAPERLDLGLTSTGFWWATFFGALVISVVRMVLDKFFDKD